MTEQRWVVIVESAKHRHDYEDVDVYSVWTGSLKGSPDKNDSIWVHVPRGTPPPSGIVQIEMHPDFRFIPEYRLVDRLEAKEE